MIVLLELGWILEIGYSFSLTKYLKQQHFNLFLLIWPTFPFPYTDESISTEQAAETSDELFHLSMTNINIVINLQYWSVIISPNLLDIPVKKDTHLSILW